VRTEVTGRHVDEDGPVARAAGWRRGGINGEGVAIGGTADAGNLHVIRSRRAAREGNLHLVGVAVHTGDKGLRGIVELQAEDALSAVGRQADGVRGLTYVPGGELEVVAVAGVDGEVRQIDRAGDCAQVRCGGEGVVRLQRIRRNARLRCPDREQVLR